MKKKKSTKKLTKILDKLDKKTNWVIPFYFEFIHAFGLVIGALIIAHFLTIVLFSGIESYKLVFFLVLSAILVAGSNWMSDNKIFKLRMTLSSIALVLIYIFIAYII